MSAAMDRGAAVVEVEDLRVELGSGVPIVPSVSFAIAAGEVLGVVGETGSGKTTIGSALLGSCRRGARIASGSIRIAGRDVRALGEEDLRRLRLHIVAYVPQDPTAALNPALRIERQLRERLPEGAGAERIGAILEDVGLPCDRDFVRRFPHQLSGGQQQRLCLAMAFLGEPEVIVFDEPTTGLDVTTQARVLKIVRRLCVEHGVAALYVSHDLAVVAGLADRILVLFAGEAVEIGSADQVFAAPQHPYTRLLLAAVPDVGSRRRLATIPGRSPALGQRPPGCVFSARCPAAIAACREIVPSLVDVGNRHRARCIRLDELEPARPQPIDAGQGVAAAAAPLLSVRDVTAFHGELQILHGVSFDVAPGECVALVGESGSGKTTLSRTIIGLHPAASGAIRFRGELLEGPARKRSRESRRRLQYIFQSPFSSLNPRLTLGDSVALPLQELLGMRRREADRHVAAALARVSLPDRAARMLPNELSGGERQRGAIARALVCDPQLLICDEVTSALDVSVQASILELLRSLLRDEGLGMVFVTHNLAVVRNLADRVAVLKDGVLVEHGATAQVLDRPTEDYTARLLSDTPRMHGAAAGEAQVV